MASLPFPIIILPSRPRPRTVIPQTNRNPNPRIKKPFEIQSSKGKLEPLYDDGYMTLKGIKEYHDAVSESLRFNDGPPRWFCPLDCGPPVEGSPLLLFLPGLDGIGMGLFMHHKALGKIFEVRCMHIPYPDRTPLEGLLKFVEDAVRLENSTLENRQIYLLGHSFGGCLALSIAARNPNIDLILVLTNPATSFGKSWLQQLFPVLRSTLGQLNIVVSMFLLLFIDYQVKQILDGTSQLNTSEPLAELQRSLISPLMNLSNLLGNISSETISWKMELLKSASSHANSRLHAVKAEVLVLASCMDSLLPSREEGEKLAKIILKCKVYYFEKLRHNIIMENDVHLCSIIKSSGMYRHANQHDFLRDFLRITNTELQTVDRKMQIIYLGSSPAMFSTMEDGKIVRGLSGIPGDGPVLLVGNHMLLGFDMLPLYGEFLRQKGIVLRGMGHPVLFTDRKECSYEGHHLFDFVRLFGAVPVTQRHLYRLLSEKSFVLLYPGGSREALHGKGEEYKLFWPAEPEFVRMAARFGARIVPFGSVGEDDLAEIFLDYNDLMRMPFIKDEIKRANSDVKFKDDKSGIRDQDLFLPYLWPKVPGRYYYLFGKPIDLRGKMDILKEREAANKMYLHVKSEVQSIISYLLKKREEDVYRSIFQRSLHQVIWGSSHPIPSFEP